MHELLEILARVGCDPLAIIVTSLQRIANMLHQCRIDNEYIRCWKPANYRVLLAEMIQTVGIYMDICQIAL
uniref:Uncharacterized protein n=1 Tax=Magallana gigas TaxID=29159 RepID=K1QJD0_MAGGI